MTARLRSMTLSKDSTILVLDNVGTKVDMDEIKSFNAVARLVGAAGGLVCGEMVDLPHDDPQPETAETVIAGSGTRHVFAGPAAIEALQWAVQALDITPVGHGLGDLRPDSPPAENLAELKRLLRHLEQ